ncbi:efflux RND transporter permease subunit [Bacteroides sp. CACC 737]|uniref:efflux RND transporter permease subunit n=1 Tax=Bacteroides sp. CACC 737 TaxID=2755405 RepID=UPI00210339CA|nr:efflux RND transporter permease subunit [Bacteroides sp. CACC 737]
MRPLYWLSSSIFLFLRDWRVTLVPCIVIPFRWIGAFFVMYLAGFSINVLSCLPWCLPWAWWWTTPS